ncbi:hypothetical protein D9M73_261610 [compost metagenome]
MRGDTVAGSTFQNTAARASIKPDETKYTARQPARSAISPEVNRARRMPRTMPLVTVPTAWPRCDGVASTAA